MTNDIYDLTAFQLQKIKPMLSEVDVIGNGFSEGKSKKVVNGNIEKEISKIPSHDLHVADLWFEANITEETKKKYTAITTSIRSEWKHRVNNIDGRDLLDTFNVMPDCNSFVNLPPYSFMLKFLFTLRKPYLSRDEEEFYLLDNPLRKEKVFRMPMITSTSWKGALRYTFWQNGLNENDEVVQRLFGNDRECSDTEMFHAGRLHFYPSFFDQTRFDIINPHDRKTGKTTERGPILLEAVRTGESADFTLTYIPLFAGADIEKEFKTDIEMLTEGICTMMTKYGFGAKTSSGFGVSLNRISDGYLKMLLPAQKTLMPLSFKSLKDLKKVIQKSLKSLKGEAV